MKSVEDQIAAAMKAKVYNVQAGLMRETALRVAGNVSQATPVDEGTARANWNLSAETPDLSTSESTTPQSYDDAQITGKEKMLYVSNGLPYIEKLNEGSSTQAPANFVELGVMLSKRQAEAAAKRGAK
ncbi:hypothetical protein K3G63_04690 [Hymenobacter sp. HSC-4F20]|uniref:hypothetical protein n=1 Tax=Hymenobacter sp. HSC-4F20 TaxID=2864135 RepID=UPI001C731112|nr:hypothetical protein [Hymenobacter sp. HSC-4F20]MBX0289721.1 hypothetical protein [Hymenobacter sp. HSC-4F20]